MEKCFLTTTLMPNGYYKVVVLGHADGHISDWRGGNYRFLTVKGQPRRGYLDEAEAKDYLLSLPEAFKNAEVARAHRSTGTSINEDDAIDTRQRVLIEHGYLVLPTPP